jgi:2-polyprenyl-3-methyl-5-hydroxy-6-metoxy-1,4-benzoquinol methylase
VNFEYKHIDEKGHEILDAISAASSFNRWMYEKIRPFCNGRILEIGSGVGNISRHFVNAQADITLSDIRDSYRKVLEKEFKGHAVHDIDIVDPAFHAKHAALLGTFDTVFALNVVEHVKEDDLAIKNMTALLKPGGLLTVLVPAHQSLYNGIDHALEHYKRYNKKMLNEVMQHHGTHVRSFYFNAMGIPAWWISGALFRQKTIPQGEMKLYNAFVPVFKIIDVLTAGTIGLSVISVIRK